MNDHLASIIHHDKVTDWQREAAASRLVASSAATGDYEEVSVTLRVRRLAVVAAIGLLMLYVATQYLLSV
jgi:hypothetical protein